MSTKAVYIAGPMRGYPKYNFDAFNSAKALWESRNYEVFSPAHHDIETGFNLKTNPQDITPEQLADMIRWDLDAVIKSDVVYMLAGWERSSGARVEHALAVFLSKRIQYQDA